MENVTDEMLDFLCPLDSDSTFVDLTAYTLYRTTFRKQQMLEEINFSLRANMLIDDLTRENDRLKLISDALGGKSKIWISN